MKIGDPWIQEQKPPGTSTKHTTTRYRVLWWVVTPDGKTRRKKGGFPTKGMAKVFIENLRKADLQHDGWSLSDDGHPNPPAQQTRGTTVVEAIDTYVTTRWNEAWKSPRTKEKNRGRLLILAAATIEDPTAANAVIKALNEQQQNRGHRPEPTTIEGWVGRYLRDYAFDPAVDKSDLPPRFTQAQDWLREKSLPLAALDDTILTERFRSRFAHLSYDTQRTYWTTAKAFTRWLVVSGRIDRNPTNGMSPIPRDLEAEKVDPDRVLAPDEVWMLAAKAEERWDLGVAATIVVLFFAAMRIGEAAGLRHRDVTFHPDGYAQLSVRTKHDRVTRRYNWGNSSVTGAPKGRTSGPGARRTVLIPPKAAKVLHRHMDQAPRQDPSQPVFTQPRGKPLNGDSFRRSRWNPLIEQVFDEGHPLAGITPHACRHGGMTYWLRLGIPHKKIQQMGGWHSLKVMLDVYAGVTRDHDEDTVKALLQDDDESHMKAVA